MPWGAVVFIAARLAGVRIRRAGKVGGHRQPDARGAADHHDACHDPDANQGYDI